METDHGSVGHRKKHQYIIQIDNNSNTDATYSVFVKALTVEGTESAEVYSTIYSQTNQIMPDTSVNITIPEKCYAICGVIDDDDLKSTTSIDINHLAHLPSKSGSTIPHVTLDDLDRATFVHSTETFSEEPDHFTIRTGSFAMRTIGRSAA